MNKFDLGCHVFVISLKDSKDRRAHIARQFANAGINFEFIDAVDGRKLDLKNSEDVDYEAILKAPWWLTPGVIGCSLSHALAYKTILDRKIDKALIIEDDCIFPEKFSDLIKAAAGNLRPLEIIMFYYSSFGDCYFSNSQSIKLTDGFELVYPMDIRRPISTTAYMIHAETCQSLLKILFPIRTSSDAWATFYEKKAINSMRCIYPMPVDTADFKSTIGYISPESFTGRALTLIDRFKIFPFYHILKYKREKIKRQMRAYKFTDEVSSYQQTA